MTTPTDYVTPNALSAGILLWPGSDTATIAVKVGYRLTQGAFVPDSVPPSFELQRAEGDLALGPSDFVPSKKSCDVIVVGASVLESSSAGLLQVDSLSKTLRPGESAGPLLSPCPDGDPLSEAFAEGWTTGQLDFAAFHAAPIDQRLTALGAEFAIRYERASLALRGTFRGPSPSLMILDVSGRGTAFVARLKLDTLALDPVMSLLVGTWRAVISLGDLRFERPIVVSCLGNVAAVTPALALAWPRRPLETVEAARARRPRRSASRSSEVAETAAAPTSVRTKSVTLPFQRRTAMSASTASSAVSVAPPSERVGGATQIAPLMTGARPELPFAVSRPPSPSSDARFDPRSAVVAEVTPASRSQAQTMLQPMEARRAPSSVPPASAPLAATPLGSLHRRPPVAAAIPPPSTPIPEASPSEPLDTEWARFAAIQRAIWQGEEPATVLARFGLDSIGFRLMKRRMFRHVSSAAAEGFDKLSGTLAALGRDG